MIAMTEWCKKNARAGSQQAVSLPISITNIQELASSRNVQRVIDAGSDHMVAISSDVVDTIHDNNQYTLFAGLYGPSGRQIQRYANVSYTAAARAQAEAICCTISILRAQQLSRLRQPVRMAWDTDTASIWITEEKSRVPDVVGETRTTNVTYFDVTSQKDPSEFARVIAHEWGHLAIPGARGFSSPEPDSAGHLGEALGLKWLSSAVTKGPLNLVVPSAGYVEASTNRFQKALVGAPPGTLAFTKRNAQGMFAYVGAVLHVADTYGDAFLGRVFQAVDADSQDAFLTAWAFILTEDGIVRLTGRGWVPLVAGVYTASRRIQPNSVKGPAGITCDTNLRVTVKRSGWYLVMATQDGLTLRRKGR